MDRDEQNKQIVRQFNECINAGDMDRCDQVISGDYVLHNFRETVRGRKGLGDSFREIRTAFPDLHVHIEDQVSDGDRVVNRITVTGTHDGDFNGIPPSHKRFKTSGLAMFQLKDGRIVEQWSEINALSMMAQIGAVDMDTATSERDS